MKLFEKNVGMADRVVRLVLGSVLVVGGALLVPPPLMYVMVVAGIVLLFTGAMGTCSLYSLLGINTLGKPRK